MENKEEDNKIVWQWQTINFGIYSATVFTDYRIIWHPVMIGDVLDFLSTTMPRTYSAEANVYCDRVMKLTWVWKQKRKPINDQSDECVKFVYDLLPTC